MMVTKSQSTVVTIIQACRKRTYFSKKSNGSNISAHIIPQNSFYIALNYFHEQQFILFTNITLAK